MKDALVGKSIRGCRIVRPLGSGGMGSVYLARHASLDREVAVKLLSDELVADGEYVARFLREARTLAKLEDSPNVVKVYDCGVEQGQYFIVMQFVEGSNLDEHLKARGGRLSSREATSIILQSLRALQATHAIGVIHRDIKPANIMIAQDGRVKLTDFGLAKPLSREITNLTSADTVVGTPFFMSPEQWQKTELDARTDIYSLGVTFYSLLAGRVPFKGETYPELERAVMNGDCPPVHAVEPSVSPRVSEVVARMMRVDREERYPDAASAGEAVRGLAAKPGTAAPAPPPPPPAGPAAAPRTAGQKQRNRRAVALAGAAVVVGALLFGAWRLSKRGDPGLAPVSARPGAVRVRVRPATDASIRVDGKRIGTLKNGALEVPDLAPGDHAVVIEAAGFLTGEKKVRITEGGTTVLDVRLGCPGMVYIDAGTLWRGLTRDEAARVAGRDHPNPEDSAEIMKLLLETPAQTVEVPGFYLDQVEVSNEEYLKFLESSSRQPPEGWSGGRFPAGEGRHPVTGVTLEDARAYAKWAGKRLPTEIEWERAVRGDGNSYYPWGNAFDRDKCNTAEAGRSKTVPVDAYEAGKSSFGVYNLAGNAIEWTETPEDDAKARWILKGGAYALYGIRGIFCWRMTAEAGVRNPIIGFRCARDGE